MENTTIKTWLRFQPYYLSKPGGDQKIALLPLVEDINLLVLRLLSLNSYLGKRKEGASRHLIERSFEALGKINFSHR
jgi:hypothetical protein